MVPRICKEHFYVFRDVHGHRCRCDHHPDDYCNCWFPYRPVYLWFNSVFQNCAFPVGRFGRWQSNRSRVQRFPKFPDLGSNRRSHCIWLVNVSPQQQRHQFLLHVVYYHPRCYPCCRCRIFPLLHNRKIRCSP